MKPNQRSGLTQHLASHHPEKGYNALGASISPRKFISRDNGIVTCATACLLECSIHPTNCSTWTPVGPNVKNSIIGPHPLFYRSLRVWSVALEMHEIYGVSCTHPEWPTLPSCGYGRDRMLMSWYCLQINPIFEHLFLNIWSKIVPLKGYIV